jgi:hypothetical protein
MDVGEDLAVSDIGVDDRQVRRRRVQFGHGYVDVRHDACLKVRMSQGQPNDFSQYGLIDDNQHKRRGVRTADLALQYRDLPSFVSGGLGRGRQAAKGIDTSRQQSIRMSIVHDMTGTGCHTGDMRLPTDQGSGRRRGC